MHFAETAWWPHSVYWCLHGSCRPLSRKPKLPPRSVCRLSVPGKIFIMLFLMLGPIKILLLKF